MLFIALLLRPLVLLTEVPGVLMTRILADDVIIVGYGPGHLAELLKAFDTMLIFVNDLGSKVSISKSFLFSTDADHRKYLANFWWKALGCMVKVVTTFATWAPT